MWNHSGIKVTSEKRLNLVWIIRKMILIFEETLFIAIIIYIPIDKCEKVYREEKLNWNEFNSKSKC